MTREEEKYWSNQPAWKINQEMERRLVIYFEKHEINFAGIKPAETFKEAAINRAARKLEREINEGKYKTETSFESRSLFIPH